ncbi:hypothetical protein NtRootA1_17980 [Arthrobacter sp. NtRootA1]|nr:hypothetical protein NtRootA1_17980 [Arthrobacter sp. NtRootA1]
MAGPTTRMQDVVRILMLIDKAAEPTTPSDLADDSALESAVGVVRSQVRLQKLDFWVRNPDYLAMELLNDYELHHDQTLFEMAAEILDSEEPELRRYPMLRYLFGAYEDLEDALSVLRQADLVVRRKKGRIGHITRTDYFLLGTGRELAAKIASDYADLGWYSARAALVVALSDGQGATQLKDRQYIVEEYLETPHGMRIPSIAQKARERLDFIRRTREENN